MEVGLSPSDTERGTAAPSFWAMSVVIYNRPSQHMLSSCFVFVTARSELRKVLFLAMSVTFWATVCKTVLLCYRTGVCPVLSACDVAVLWPNSWMN